MPKKSIYDPYTDWIIEHYKDYRNCKELTDALKDIFGLDKANKRSIKFWFDSRFGMTTVYGRYDFSDEEKEFIKKYYPGHGPRKTAEMINEVFHTNRTSNSVRTTAYNLDVHISDALQNKIYQEKLKKMHNTRRMDCGSIVETSHHGYAVKLDDGTWKNAAVVIWENANGPLPKGYQLIYLDGDKSNHNLDNLYLAPRKLAYQVQTNKCYKSGDSELTKSLIKYYELRNALGVNCVQWKYIQEKFERKFNKLIKEEVKNARSR